MLRALESRPIVSAHCQLSAAGLRVGFPTRWIASLGTAWGFVRMAVGTGQPLRIHFSPSGSEMVADGMNARWLFFQRAAIRRACAFEILAAGALSVFDLNR
eukprot:Amastigsp_a512428_3.p3 type:complete len:101 gc:universal Amastigsp_a512428_3:236-538(+)